MKTIIIGLGNPILTDDGVGVKVAYALQEELQVRRTPRFDETMVYADKPGLSETGVRRTFNGQIDITEASVGGLRLMEMMVGYDKVIIIDALTTGSDPPGTLRRLTLPDLEAISPTQHSASAHDTSLVTALAMGKRMGLHLPAEVVIFGVSVENIDRLQRTADVGGGSSDSRCHAGGAGGIEKR